MPQQQFLELNVIISQEQRHAISAFFVNPKYNTGTPYPDPHLTCNGNDMRLWEGGAVSVQHLYVELTVDLVQL